MKRRVKRGSYEPMTESRREAGHRVRQEFCRARKLVVPDARGVDLRRSVVWDTADAEGRARRFWSPWLPLYWVMSVPIVRAGASADRWASGRKRAAGPIAVPLPIVVLGNGLGGFEAFGGNIEVPLAQTAMNTLFALDRYRRFPASIVIASGGTQPAPRRIVRGRDHRRRAATQWCPGRSHPSRGPLDDHEGTGGRHLSNPRGAR